MSDLASPDVAPSGRRDPVSDRIEVRLLGPLRVRRADGSLVDPREWRTGKTADLVRLLALHCGQAVPVDTLLDALWPQADPQRGRASLRTAASQVRRVLGHDCLHRRFGGLELRDVWVDAATFTSLVREVSRLAGAGQAAEAVTVAREADALYLDDFRANGDGEDWALSARADLAKAHLELICDAADAAVELGWMRDAVEFAGRAVALDRYCERAYRALMQGYAGLGETSQALLEFESCRTFLSEELGAEPSPQTRALHGQLLTATTVQPATPPFVGRRDEVNQLKGIIEASARSQRTVVLALVGAPGVGKSRVVREAAREVAARLVVLSCAPVDGRPVDCLEPLRALLSTRAQAASTGATEREALVVVLDGADRAQESSIQRTVDVMHGAPGALTVVLTARAGGSHGQPLAALAPSRPSPGIRRPHRLELAGLPVEEVAELAGKLLGGDVTAELVRVLVQDSDATPGRLVATVRDWSRAGRIAATAGGLVLVPRGGIRTTEHATKQIAPLLEKLDGRDLSVLHLLAVLGGPTDPSVILPLLEDDEIAPGTRRLQGEVQAALDRLVDLSVLVSQPTGYGFRDPLLRDALESWLRPTARRDLHRRVAERGFISTAARVEHWLKAGETQLGRSAAVAAAAEAMADARYEDARTHLMQVCSLGPMPETVAGDRVELFERLGDVCAVLGRRHEARAAFSVAVSVSRTHSLPDLDRVAAKRDEVSGGDWLDDSPPQAHTPAASHGDEWDDQGDVGALGSDVEHRLRESVEVADRRGDPGARAEARLRLSTAGCIPRRQFGLGRHWAQEALSITVDPGLRARALLASWLPSVLLGQAELAERPMEQVADLAERSGDVDLRRRVHVLQALVTHDLARPSFDDRWAAAAAACADQPDPNWTWIRMRIATERGDLVAAQAADRSPSSVGIGPFARQMRVLASSVLHAELGDVGRAIKLLESVVEAQRLAGWSLLMPEAFARLIILHSAGDLTTAKENFDQLDRSVGGDHGFPREQCLRLLARGAIRSANGQHAGAEAAASNACDVASSSGLPHLTAYARQAQALHSSRTDPWSDLRAEVDAASSVARVRAGMAFAGS